MYIFTSISVRLLILLQNRCMQISESFLTIIPSSSCASPCMRLKSERAEGGLRPFSRLAFSVRSSIKAACSPGKFSEVLQHFLVVH